MFKELPLIVYAESKEDLSRWYEVNCNSLKSQLLEYGAVLFRGFENTSERHLMKFLGCFSGDILEYTYRSTPRTAVGGGVYTASEYSAGLTVQLHNENSYQSEWPRHLLFSCLVPAQGGGGHGLFARNVNITIRIDPSIRDKFHQKKVVYVRNFGDEVDLSWQTVFQTDSRSEVEEFCRRKRISFEWLPPNGLRTKQTCSAFATHPETGDELWFNQIHLFHPAGLDRRTQELLYETYALENLPRNVTYGDGSAIEESVIEHVVEAFNNETSVFEWQAGDILIADNMLVCHGRTPYKGMRRMLVGLCDLYAPQVSLPDGLSGDIPRSAAP